MVGSIAHAQEVRPLVGAIRWDAWTGGEVTAQVERTLGPAKYRDRLPWFADVTGENTVRIDGGRQEVMDAEIEYAAAAGLDYWAFLVYPMDNSMSAAIGQYLASARRDRVRFCVILHNTLHAPDASWPAERDRLIALLREPGYQTVLGGRPLVYAFSGGNLRFDRFGEFLATAREKGLNPYCVFMGWSPATDYAKVSQLGFDAVSAYARGGSQPAFADLVRDLEQRYWQEAANAKIPCVPLVTTGWDKNPRRDNPVSWEKGHGYHSQTVFPARATPAEIAAHLERALAFVRQHPAVCQANATIVYAWNEYDEGGWLAPTRGQDGKPDNSRLAAVRQVLRPE